MTKLIDYENETSFVKSEYINAEKKYKELITVCKQFSSNLIYNIIKPKKVLILGPSLANMMKINYNHRDDSVLRTSDELF